MNEDYLYQFFGTIFTSIPLIGSRFVLAEGYGNDLNADNNNDVIIGNAINQTAWKKKYPCSVLMPLVEVGGNEAKGTTRYRIELYFLTTSFTSGNGIIKNANIQTNTSKVPIKDDWNEMRVVAESFKNTLLQIMYSDIQVLRNIRPVKSTQYRYDRVSLMGNDRLSGVRLSFEIDLVIGCEIIPTLPTITPPSSCGVCSPIGGEIGWVWSILPDGTLGWALPVGGGGGGGGNPTVKVTVSSNYTALSVPNTKYVIIVTEAATITLPTAIGNTCEYMIKTLTTSAVNVVFTAGQNADDSTNIPLKPKYHTLTFIPNNSNYNIF